MVNTLFIRGGFKVFVCLILFSILISCKISGQKANFKIYNAMMFQNMPNLSSSGISTINMIYDDSLLVKSISHPTNLNERSFNHAKFLNETKKLTDKSDIPVCLDIESWNLMEPYFKNSIKKYKYVLNQFKRSNSNLKVGFYGVFPYADAYLWEAFKGNRSKNFMGDWRSTNQNIATIASSVDIIYPSCYTRTKNVDTWKKAFMMQYQQIKKVTSKPIYAFIWPQYYNRYDKSINNKFIDYNTWMAELEYLYKYCDGIVIWSPPFNLTTRKKLYWNNNLAWWSATKDFVKKHKITAN
jgi:hypothetical protein